MRVKLYKGPFDGEDADVPVLDDRFYEMAKRDADGRLVFYWKEAHSDQAEFVGFWPHVPRLPEDEW